MTTTEVPKNSPVMLGVCLVTGLAVGAVIGAKWMERKLSVEFEERFEREVAETRVFYTNIRKEKYPTPEDAVKDLVPKEAGDALKAYQGGERIMYDKISKGGIEDPPEEEDPSEETEVVKSNVFESSVRNKDVAYLISEDEFMQNDPEYLQETLTYYQKDGVLVDHREDVIDDVESAVGPEALSSFGKDPKDPNVVRVRNERIDTDFEICMSEGSYAKDILGIEEDDQTYPRSRNRS